MAIFAGLRATNDFTLEGQRPKSWRETMLRLYPNGSLALTALTSLMKSEKVDDPEYNWYTKVMVDQLATVTGTYTGEGVATALTGAVAVGALVSVKMSAADVAIFKPGHTVLFRATNDPNLDTMGMVTKTAVAADNSFVVVKMLEPSRTGYDLVTAKVQNLYVIGSAYEEGALIGPAITMDPVKFVNYTQIFRNSLEITRTASRTKLRTPAAYAEAKKDALELHGIEMEKAFIFGIPTETVGPEGKPLRTTGGLMWAIRKNGGLVSHFPSDVPAGSTWGKDGYKYFMRTIEKMFRYGGKEKLCYAGTGAVLALNELAYDKGDWHLTASEGAFGIKVNKLVTPFGELTLATHPLFSHTPTNRNTMLVFEPANVKYRFIDDTTFYEDNMKHGKQRRDAKQEEFLTEAGLEFGSALGWGLMTGIGVDAPVVKNAPAAPAVNNGQDAPKA